MANLSNINNKFLVTTGGNVLIGRTSATGTSKLQVTGSLLIGTDINSGIPLVVQETTADGFAIAFMRNTNSTGGNGLVIDVNSTGGGYIQDWRQASTVKMRLLQNGNLGIGTDSPGTIHGQSYGTTKLHIDGGTDRGQLVIEGDSLAAIAFSDNGTTANERVFYQSVNGGLFNIKPLNDNGTSTASTGISMLHNGNVGIGDTNPSFILDTNITSSRARFKANTGNANIELSSIEGHDYLIQSKSDSSFAIYDEDEASERLVIDSSGNVGIGTGNNNFKIGFASERAIIGYNTSYGSTGAAYIDGGATSNKDIILNPVSSGNVGIGNTSPDAKLHVDSGTSNTVALFESTDATAKIFVKDNSTSNDYSVGIGAEGNDLTFHAASGGTERMRIDSSGNVGIGTTSFDSKLTVSQGAADLTGVNNSIRIENHTSANASPSQIGNGIVFAQKWWSGTAGLRVTGGIFGIKNAANGTFGGGLAFYTQPSSSADMAQRMVIDTSGDLHVDGDVVAYSTTISDKRLKDNVKPLESSLDKVMNLKGVEYVWNNGSRKGQKDIGFIAQEVEEIIPEIVREKQVIFNKEEKYKTVDYEKITAVLVEAVKELTAKVERLENNKCNCK